MRRDLADVRLADRVFAPHYAEPLLRMLARPATLVDEGRGPLARLETGERFEVLEFAGGKVWGIARGLVGYVDEDAIA